jgi:hypothetical protein
MQCHGQNCALSTTAADLPPWLEARAIKLEKRQEMSEFVLRIEGKSLSKNQAACLKGSFAFVKFRLGRLAAPRFSSLSGCLDV